MKLKLERPIVFFDIESTGLNPQEDRIIELAMCKVNTDYSKEVKTSRFNPQMPIPEKSSEIHGITNEDVKDEHTFKQCAKAISSFIEGCELAGFNCNAFDIPMLHAEMMRCGVYLDLSKTRFIDAGNIFKIQEPRTLTAAYKFYCSKELEDAHSAEADILATVEVFEAQMERYEDIPKDIDQLHLYCNYGKQIIDISGKFTTDDQGNICLNFGKYKGEPASEHLDFIDWMYYRADFPADTRAVCAKLLGENY